MDKKAMRRFVWLPQWRVDELEAWLSGMSAQGWELTKLESRQAYFKRAEAGGDGRYYCHVFDPCVNAFTAQQEKEHYQKQVEEIERRGWSHVADYGEVGVFRGREGMQAELPVPPQDEVPRIIALYKRTSGATMFLWFYPAIILFLMYLQFGISISHLLNDPFLLIEAGIVLFLILKVPAIFIQRVVTIRKIRRRYAQAAPHALPVDDAACENLKRVKSRWNIKWGIAALVVLFLLSPILPYYIQRILYGEFPHIPNGEIPIIRLRDVKPGSYVMNNGTNDSFYRIFYGIIIPTRNVLIEDDGSSYVISERYRTIAPWYAELVAQYDYLLLSIVDEELEHADRYGFDSIRFCTFGKEDGDYMVRAIRGKTMYVTHCVGVSVSLEDVLTLMGEKAKADR